MKNKLFTFLCSVILVLSVLPSSAQQKNRYLVETLKPSDSFQCGLHPLSSGYPIRMGGLDWKEGFVLSYASGPLRLGFVEYQLNGKYNNISFVLGATNGGTGSYLKTNNPNAANHTVGIVSVYGDGIKLLDEKIGADYVPKFYTLNVKGIKTIHFAIEQNEITVGFADVALWTNEQTPKQTQHQLGKAQTTQLVKELMPYKNKANVVFPDHNNSEYKRIEHPALDPTNVKINGKDYTYGLYTLVTPGMVNNNISDAHFNLRGQYQKMSFLVGPVDMSNATDGKAWFTIKADDKIVYEEEFASTDIARREVIDIQHCEQLTVEFQDDYRTCALAVVDMKVYPDGVEPENDATSTTVTANSSALRSLPSPCKLISNIEPYAYGSSADPILFSGQSQYVTFSMGGEQFNEGLLLKARNNVLYGETPAFATFALGGEFDYVTFTTGWVTKCGVLKDDTLQVFCDDNLVYEAQLHATYPNQSHTVAIHKCQSLRFSLLGSHTMYRPTYGIGDIVVYRGTPVANNLFSHLKPNCPNTIDLLDLGKPYIHYISTMKDYPEKTLYDGSTKKNYFELDGQRIYKGFLLQTSIHADLDGNNADGAIGMAMCFAAYAYAAPLILAAAGEAHESSLAAFNTYGEYNWVTFTVAVTNSRYSGIQNKRKVTATTHELYIGADQNPVQTITLSEGMEPTTYTVNIRNCHQLLFWLQCGERDASSQFLFYDIQLSK